MRHAPADQLFLGEGELVLDAAHGHRGPAVGALISDPGVGEPGEHLEYLGGTIAHRRRPHWVQYVRTPRPAAASAGLVFVLEDLCSKPEKEKSYVQTMGSGIPYSRPG